MIEDKVKRYSDRVVSDMEYLSLNLATVLQDLFSTIQFDIDTSFLTKIDHQVYDVDVFMHAFFGRTDQQFLTRFNLLILTVVSRFNISLELDSHCHSGLQSMQLMVRLIEKVSTAVGLKIYKQSVALQMADIAYQIDNIYMKAFTLLNTREESFKLADRSVVVAV